MNSIVGKGRQTGGVQRSLDVFVGELEGLVEKVATGGHLQRNLMTTTGDLGYLVNILNSGFVSVNRVNVNTSPSRFRFMMGRSGFSHNEPL